MHGETFTVVWFLHLERLDGFSIRRRRLRSDEDEGDEDTELSLLEYLKKKTTEDNDDRNGGVRKKRVSL